MESDEPIDALARLAPSARAPERSRRRVGVGAAVVLLIAALVAAVAVSALGQPTGQVVAPVGGGAGAGGTGPGAGAGTGAGTGSGSGSGGGTGSASGSPDGSASGGILFVHVLGAVRRPGLFEVHDGARVIDVVAAAGGLLATADPAGVNLARLVGDGEQVYIPKLGEAQPGAPPGGTGAVGAPHAPGGKVSLNSASVSELDTLPRIGPLMAQRIIDYREANGPFAAIEDLRNVTGIGDKTFDGLKELITP
ncbi:ComEA family DNA-binding protein [Cryobacterium tagatosivorans]|uniref:Helix-hairpin-helix domain-containing protein n=1 Tax=Cryobacterium tagatosivorans TaxID=1259199 RepID=A0A4R8UEH2_9MICO|nr:helix-hairpin-helix domain-containing protein [Cryobacterium tagatosivorans]TFB51984.1 helix-hairpin-helix domain-containing protein [Cryobacterium tagatosivorans]